MQFFSSLTIAVYSASIGYKFPDSPEVLLSISSSPTKNDII